MVKIILEALTDKGKKAITTDGKQSRMGKAALKMCGFKQSVVSEDPYIVSIKLNVPPEVGKQIEYALVSKFAENGAVKDRDYKLRVE